MWTNNERLYRLQVKALTDDFYAACLGQNTHITAIVPQNLVYTPMTMAANIARQLTSTLAPFGGDTECQKWLYDIALYLLTECNEDDQTFREIVLLANVKDHIRDALFSSLGQRKSRGTPPVALKYLDLAIIQLLKSKGLFENAEMVFTKLNSINSLGFPPCS